MARSQKARSLDGQKSEGQKSVGQKSEGQKMARSQDSKYNTYISKCYTGYTPNVLPGNSLDRKITKNYIFSRPSFASPQNNHMITIQFMRQPL